MKKRILILMGMLLAPGVMQAARTAEEQAQLNQDLVEAVKEQRAEDVGRLLDEGANPNITVEKPYGSVCLLHFVLQNVKFSLTEREGISDITKLLINCERTDLNARDYRNGFTALHLLARVIYFYPCLDLFLYLLSRGADPDILNNDNKKPWDCLVFPGMAGTDQIGFIKNRVKEVFKKQRKLKEEELQMPPQHLLKHSTQDLVQDRQLEF